MTAPAIAMTGIDKRFGAVHANKTVDFTVERGTVRGLIGENGAGKSTLMSILYGFYAPDQGHIAVNGKAIDIRAPADAIAAGIGMVHQHFMLVETFTVVENLMLGAEGGALTARGASAMRARLAALSRDYGLDVDPDAVIADLAVGQLQRVEILKALVRGADILILDEPTAVLTPDEADKLFVLVRRLADEGKAVIIVTHKLKEIMAVTDQVSVMRRGEMVATVETGETSQEQLAELMVGRHVALTVDKTIAEAGKTVLEVRDLSLRDSRGTLRLDQVGFDVKAGEIVGIAGVSGNGQSELLEIIAGMRRPSSGTIALGGALLDCGGRDDPQSLRAQGLRHVPEDRQRRGLVKPFDAAESAILGCTDEQRFGFGPFLNHRAVVADCASKMATFDVRPADPGLTTALFSGGNQQKIVLAREIERDPVLLLVGQPTRGVDIGAIELIHRRLIALRDEGKAILVVSTELDEVLALADRVLVMSGGRITGERQAASTDERDIGLLMAGIGEARE
ncbi:ABC transporter ATP-binding protein [Phreatobacter stygius]|uniref:ABC transporter ATP-binding protein n=1 Tax=Phreatobacter stygius TaxID=1940610 RepID=A0A4D7B1C0_9HYPH|nr:ABC transporter ATP-binding protein [Phreatobacter stygius]QCI64763.1 ABC transporter ATP-binding protein [Phreatobacter stygius]